MQPKVEAATAMDTKQRLEKFHHAADIVRIMNRCQGPSQNDRVREAVLLQPVHRSSKQVERLAKFLRRADILQETDMKVLREFARSAVAVVMRAGEYVYRQGQHSDGLFVVLEGTLQEWADHYHASHSRSQLPVVVNWTEDNALAINREVSDLKFLSSCGGKDVLSDQRRSSNICCTSQSALLIKVDGHQLADALAGKPLPGFSKEVDRLRQLDEFRATSQSTLASLVLWFTEVRFHPGDVILPQGPTPKGCDGSLLWILSGSAACYIDPNFDSSNPRAVASTNSAMLIHLCDISPNTVVGDTSLVLRQVTRRVVALTNVVALRVDIADMIKHFPIKLVQQLEEVALQKVRYERERVKQELKHANDTALLLARPSEQRRGQRHGLSNGHGPAEPGWSQGHPGLTDPFLSADKVITLRRKIAAGYDLRTVQGMERSFPSSHEEVPYRSHSVPPGGGPKPYPAPQLARPRLAGRSVDLPRGTSAAGLRADRRCSVDVPRGSLYSSSGARNLSGHPQSGLGAAGSAAPEGPPVASQQQRRRGSLDWKPSHFGLAAEGGAGSRRSSVDSAARDTRRLPEVSPPLTWQSPGEGTRELRPHKTGSQLETLPPLPASPGAAAQGMATTSSLAFAPARLL